MLFRKKKTGPVPGESGGGHAPAVSGSPASPLPREYLLRLADEYARYCSLSLEVDPEQKEREQLLLAGGKNAQAAVTEYLIGCARGQAAYGWWSRAADLTRLLRKIAPGDAEPYLFELINIQTNIWEYHTQVIQVAEQELLEIRKAASGKEPDLIPPEDAAAELRQLYNSGITTDETIRRAIEMLPSVEFWADSEKGFYYYIIGEALKQRNKDDERLIPFYAAQLYYQPEPTSLGWHELKGRVPWLTDLPAGFETARRLVKEYPLPDTLEELLENP